MTNESSAKWQNLDNLTLTERDLAIVLDLFQKKYMNTKQIQRRHWRNATGRFGAEKACQRRLRKLVAAGILRRIPQAVKRTEGSKPDLLTLDKNSIPLLVQELGIEPHRVDLRAWVNEENNPQVKHILQTTEVQLAWYDACEACQIEVDTWLDEKELRFQYKGETGTFVNAESKSVKKPIADAFTIINWTGKRGYFWLEVDRSNINVTHSVLERPSIANKITRFLEWEVSQAFKEEFHGRPMRQLFITQRMGRMHNMLMVTQQMITQWMTKTTPLTPAQKETKMQRLAKCFLFTTFDLFYAHNPLTHPIWYQVGIETPQILLQ